MLRSVINVQTPKFNQLCISSIKVSWRTNFENRTFCSRFIALTTSIQTKVPNFWGKLVWQVAERLDVHTPKSKQLYILAKEVDWWKNYINRTCPSRVIVITSIHPEFLHKFNTSSALCVGRSKFVASVQTSTNTIPHYNI